LSQEVKEAKKEQATVWVTTFEEEGGLSIPKTNESEDSSQNEGGRFIMAIIAPC